MSNILQAKNGFDVTPSDGDNLQSTGVVLYIGTGGDIKVNASSGHELTFKNIPDGYFFPVQVNKVFSTGTTASDIIGLTL